MTLRILVIDDNAINLDLMLYLLRSFGHDVRGASDGIAGLEGARSGGFDIVLSDILMPGIDGYEFARRMKNERRTASVPIVAVTALAMSGDRARIMGSGFDGCISKPIEPQTFVAQVEAFASGAR